MAIRQAGDAARARFWAGLGAARRCELEGAPGWQARLDAALDEGAALGPGWLARQGFAAEVAARLDADDEDLGRWWDHLRPADLYLACACALGVAAALACFESRYGAEIGRAARRFERPGLPAEDLVQQLRAKLFAAERPRIASYTGQGFLQNWVRVTATRAFIDCCRAEPERPEVPIADDICALIPEPGADPELALGKREHAASFKAAVAEAVGALDAADRLLLRQHLVEGLTVDQLGALYHLHRATAARRVARAREALLDGARAALARRVGLPPDRLGGVLDLVASHLDASVERLLR